MKWWLNQNDDVLMLGWDENEEMTWGKKRKNFEIFSKMVYVSDDQ